MKKKFNRKKTLFSVIFGFALSLICGFGFLDVIEAKALDSSYNIADYAWANYFDASRLINTSASVDSDNSVKYSVMNTSDEAVNEILVARDVFGSDGIFRYMVDDVVYTLNYDFELTGFEDTSWAGGFGLVLRNSSTGDDLDYWGHYYNDYLISVIGSSSAIDLYVNYGNRNHITTYPIPAGASITFSHLAIYRGTSIKYEYTPFFYDLDSIPNPPPTIEGSGSGDSGSGDTGSGDSGSDTPDVPDLPDVPDIPEVDGSYQEGYLAGLAQAQYGFLGTNNIFLVISYTDGYIARYKIEPTRIFGGLDFTNVYNDYVPNINDTVSFSRLEFYFSPFVRPSALTLYGEGPAYFFNSNMVVNPVVSGNSNPVLNWHVSSDNSTLYETTLVRGANLGDWQAVSLFSANYTSFDFLKGLRLFVTDSNLFENGYLVGSGEGYDKGYYEGLEANQQEIYDKAYDEGHRIGYDDGFVVGSRANNSFLGLFTAVIDAPVLTFTSMLDFDILGYNMKSIVLSLLSIALVVAIIRLFSKGGSAG